MHSIRTPPSSPDEQIRLATWNAANHVSAAGITKLMTHGSIALLAIQEPWMRYNQGWASSMAHITEKAGYSLLTSKHQLIVTDWEAIESRTLTREVALNGRLIAITIGLHSHQKVTIISVYGVTGNGQYADGRTKDEIRRQLQTTLQRTIRRAKMNGPNDPVIVMGDLQDTLTTTAYDNEGAQTYPQHPHGTIRILMSEEHKMRSILHNPSAGGTYITRRPKGNASGGSRNLSHLPLRRSTRNLPRRTHR